MPISAQDRFVRQRPVEMVHAGLVIPANAKMKHSLQVKLQQHGAETGPPSAPPHKFTFHYVDAPIDNTFLEDGATIDSGIYEFSVRDALIAVFDLPALHDDEFCWSFSSTSCIDVLAAVKIGETLDVVFDQPLAQAFHVKKYHFPSGVSDSGYGTYSVHLTIDGFRPEGFRVVSAFEPQAKRTNSRLPFFFGFRVFCKRETDLEQPVWRELLGDAIRQALHTRWQHALLYTAFALEAFIDHRLAERLQASGIADTYIDHILRVAERRYELHALNDIGPKLSKSGLNKLSERLNSDVFEPRNRLAHGKIRRETTPEQVVRALKTTVEFIWDWDLTARRLLFPVLPVASFESMIDERLIADCQSESA